MDASSDPPLSDLGLRRLLWIFAGLAVVLLGLLAFVPARAYFSEWRAHQRRYDRLALAAHLPNVALGVKQIWRPELDVADRCPSCHLAADGAAPIPSERLFAAHPQIPHAPREFGCTVCHGGQGRATTAAAAHGTVAHWNDPILPHGYEQAGCGTCHSGLKIGPAKIVEKGRTLVVETKCGSCHRSGTGAPDLSGIGLHGFRADWHAKHVERSVTAKAGTLWANGFSPLADEEVAAVTEYLHTQVGAPRLMAAKALAYRLGCRGCHRIGGVGGDDGPDLSDEGRRLPGDLDLTRVSGPRALPNWLNQHFLDPPRVVRGSQMPRLGLSSEEADQLTLYMLSLRVRAIPEELAPGDRVRGSRLGERDFSIDGESLFGVFCSACHGQKGEGRKFATFESTFPAIGEPEFLAIADDPFLRKTLAAGRPGRRMPAWGSKDGGLRLEEIDAVIAFLRSLEPTAPTLDAVAKAPVDRDRGDALYRSLCSHCHGAGGEGSVVAPPLAATDNPAVREDSRIYGTVTVGVAGTAMGSFKQLDAGSLHSLIAAVRGLPPVAAKREGWAPHAGDAQRGKDSFAKNCARCHGALGEGKTAPAVTNAAFLAAATDGYLTATILRGRGPTAMPHFGAASTEHPKLSPEEVADQVAFLRSVAR